VGGSDDIGWVEAEVDGDFAPSGLDGSDGVGQSTVLYKEREGERMNRKEV
jgi:hypothetical protein